MYTHIYTKCDYIKIYIKINILYKVYRNVYIKAWATVMYQGRNTDLKWPPEVLRLPCDWLCPSLIDLVAIICNELFHPTGVETPDDTSHLDEASMRSSKWKSWRPSVRRRYGFDPPALAGLTTALNSLLGLLLVNLVPNPFTGPVRGAPGH